MLVAGCEAFSTELLKGVSRAVHGTGYELPPLTEPPLTEPPLAEPPLTTVDQPIQEMGAQGLTMLIDLLAGRQIQEHLRLPTHLVQRASCARAR